MVFGIVFPMELKQTKIRIQEALVSCEISCTKLLVQVTKLGFSVKMNISKNIDSYSPEMIRKLMVFEIISGEIEANSFEFA